MAGLLSGIGQVLAGGVAGGAKAAGESFVEQAKQEALAAREENMLRIQEKFAGARDTANFERGIKQRQVEAGIAETKEAARYKERTAEEEKIFQRRQEEEEITYQRRRTEAGKDMEAMLTFKNNLPDKTRSAIEKEVAGLISLGVPKKEALALGLSSRTKEESAEERALLVTWRTVFTENTKAGAAAEDAAKTATNVTGVNPVELWSRIQARGGGGGPEKPATVNPIDLYEQRKKNKSAATKTVPTAPLPLNEGYEVGALGEEGVPPGFSPREWNDMSPAAKAQARKDYIAKRKARSTGLLENK